MGKLQNVFTLVFLTVVFVIAVKADIWVPPGKKTYCSDNKKFCFKVIPKKLTGAVEYFEDKADGKENAGADKRVNENFCKGIFYARDKYGNLRERWKIKLINEVSPVDVLVSNEGDYVVTFDNWHSVGYGNDVIVIYDAADGKLVKNLGLSDFLTDDDIKNLPATSSSIWWRGKHFIENAGKRLVLQVSKGRQDSEKNIEYFQVRVDLKTGSVLDEKRDRLPKLQFLIEEPGAASQEQNSDAVSENEKENECFAGKDFKKLGTADFLKRVISKEMPTYSPAAKAVRASGKIVVEVLVSETGDATCARLISGSPLLGSSVVAAVKKWKFEKSDTSYSGYIAFEAKSALVSPEGKIIE
jgi:TonB family protein